MTIIIQGHSGSRHVTDADGKLAYRIQDAFWGSRAQICNVFQQTVYSTCISEENGRREYLIYRKNNPHDVIASAHLYNVEQSHSLYQPPVERLELESKFGLLVLVPQLDGGCKLLRDGQPVGAIQAYRPHKGYVIECDLQDAAFVSALYCLYRYLKHENDRMIV